MISFSLFLDYPMISSHIIFDNLTVITYTLVILLLLLFSMMMSASEAAFFSLKPADTDQLQNEDSKKSKTILKLLEKPRDLLATILITNNLVNVGIIIISANLIDLLFPSNYNALSRWLIDIFGITSFILIFGEVMPKIYATRNVLNTTKLLAIKIEI